RGALRAQSATYVDARRRRTRQILGALSRTVRGDRSGPRSAFPAAVRRGICTRVRGASAEAHRGSAPAQALSAPRQEESNASKQEKDKMTGHNPSRFFSWRSSATTSKGNVRA